MTAGDRRPSDRLGPVGMRRALAEADSRFHVASSLRSAANKIFPTHFSFLWGEIALYSFVVLLLSGTYLALYFDPSMQEITYHGTFDNLRDVEMSRAFASTLDISFDVRGGLFVRQVHHWAALLFAAAILVHMLRIFFTGAFRRPRETNWLIGVGLFALAVAEGFLGYSLPDDLLSGTGLRIMSGVMLSLPVIGTWAHWLVFGGEYPSMEILPRFYIGHVFIVPGVILALIAVHLAAVWFQKHTQFPGPGKTERNVVGTRTVPIFVSHSLILQASVVGMLCLLGGVAQINPIFNYGPYRPDLISPGAQPDWYLGFVEGALRLWPPWELHLGNYTVPAQFFPGVLLPVGLTAATLAYPFFERKVFGDPHHHNLLQRPRDNPIRTALGVMGVTFYFWLLLAGGDDVIAFKLRMPIEELVWTGRIGILVVPPLAYWVTYRICRRLQRFDRDVLAYGIATGIIVRRGEGDYLQVRQPLRGVVGGRAEPLVYGGSPVPRQVDEEALAASTAPAGDRPSGQSAGPD
jgi:ubiquinol-cytochrome c reductase cytochrome b subunit